MTDMHRQSSVLYKQPKILRQTVCQASEASYQYKVDLFPRPSCNLVSHRLTDRPKHWSTHKAMHCIRVICIEKTIH